MTMHANSATMQRENFILECRNTLAELEAYHQSKKRQIEHCFQKLLDNIPQEIKNISINECIAVYAQALGLNDDQPAEQKKQRVPLATGNKENNNNKGSAVAEKVSKKVAATKHTAAPAASGDEEDEEDDGEECDEADEIVDQSMCSADLYVICCLLIYSNNFASQVYNVFISSFVETSRARILPRR